MVGDTSKKQFRRCAEQQPVSWSTSLESICSPPGDAFIAHVHNSLQIMSSVQFNTDRVGFLNSLAVLLAWTRFLSSLQIGRVFRQVTDWLQVVMRHGGSDLEGPSGKAPCSTLGDLISRAR